MARDYSSYLTTKPHGTAVMEPGDEAIVLHGSDTIQSCLTPRVTEVKALLNIQKPQIDAEATHNAMTCTDRLRCGHCGEYKPFTAFGKRASAVVRNGRDFVCRACRQRHYDAGKKMRLSDVMKIK